MSIDLQTVVANALTLNTDTFVHPALQGLSEAIRKHSLAKE